MMPASCRSEWRTRLASTLPTSTPRRWKRGKNQRLPYGSSRLERSTSRPALGFNLDFSGTSRPGGNDDRISWNQGGELVGDLEKIQKRFVTLASILGVTVLWLLLYLLWPGSSRSAQAEEKARLQEQLTNL